MIKGFLPKLAPRDLFPTKNFPKNRKTLCQIFFFLKFKNGETFEKNSQSEGGF